MVEALSDEAICPTTMAKRMAQASRGVSPGGNPCSPSVALLPMRPDSFACSWWSCNATTGGRLHGRGGALTAESKDMFWSDAGVFGLFDLHVS